MVGPRTASLQLLIDQVSDHPQNTTKGNRRIRTHQYEDEVRKFRAVQARSKTTQASFARTDHNANTLAPLIFNRVVRQVQAIGTSAQRLDRKDLAHLLPNELNTPRQLSIHEALNSCPMIVNNAELAEIIDLEKCDLSSGPAPLGSHIYIRSWTLSASEFRAVINALTYIDDESEQWTRVLDMFPDSDTTDAPNTEIQDEQPEEQYAAGEFDAQNPETFTSTLQQQVNPIKAADQLKVFRKAGKTLYFTVRYIGTCNGPMNPMDRFLQDLNSRTSGILSEFQETLQRLFPAVSEAAEVHYITRAALSLAEVSSVKLSSSNQGTMERAHIEFFDHATLLNRQHGGYFAEYVPEQGDVDCFKSARIDFYHRLQREANFTPAAMRAQVVQHFQNIQTFANEDSATGTSRHEFTDGLRDAMTTQALPPMYRKAAAVMIIVGKDITLNNYVGEKTFFEGKSHAAKLTRDMFRLHASHESEYLAGTETWNSQAFETKLLPFIDFWYWLVHTDWEYAIIFMREYFRITRPLISATMSKSVNRIVRANFAQQSRVKVEKLIDYVAVPTIQYYDEDHDEDSAFINMAQYHPGADKYSAYQYEVRRFLDLSWQASQFLSSIMMDIIDQHIEQEEKLPSRKVLCERALGIFQDSKIEYALFENLENARKQLKQKLEGRKPRRPRALGAKDVRSLILNPDGLRRVALLGKAEGEADSRNRRRQLRALWDEEVPDLHLVVPHDSERREEWFEQFMALQPDESLFLKVVSQLESEAENIKNLVRVAQPDWRKEESWMKTLDPKEAATIRRLMWIRKKSSDNNEQQSAKPILRYNKFLSAKDLQGSNVAITIKGVIRVRWKQDEETQHTIMFNSKMAVPTEGEGETTRTIDFTKDGIDILDATGNPFRTFHSASNKLAKATIEKAQLAGTESGAQPSKVAETPVTDWGVEPGLKALAANSTKENPEQNRPPQIGDALYVLNAWLDERFPDGGELRTAPAERVANSTEDVKHFVSFVNRPEWAKHPYVESFWIPRLDKLKPDLGLLEKNISILRGVTTDKRQHPRLTKEGTQAKETVYLVGAPGSAAADPMGDRAAAKPAKKSTKATKAAGNDEDNDEEMEDESVVPSKKRAKPAKKASKAARAAANDDDDEEMEDQPAAPSKKRKVAVDEEEVPTTTDALPAVKNLKRRKAEPGFLDQERSKKR